MLAPFAGKRVAAFRGTHRSFIDAAILLDIDVDWLYCTEKLSLTPETAAVFVTAVDYYGNVADISTLVKTVNVPVLTDNAHGAYLALTDKHPVRLGAAMSADSAHKTLPALTGAAYLHISADYVNKYQHTVGNAMNLFGTTSPSYLILDSLDLCNVHISDEKHRAETAFSAVTFLKEQLCEHGYILPESDLLRVVTDCNAYGYSGHDYAGELRKRGITCEMHDNRYVVLMFSTVTGFTAAGRVYKAMCDIPVKPPVAVKVYAAVMPEQAMSVRSAYFADKKTLPLTESAGEVCAGVHVTVPPCVPLIMPGEVVSHEAVSALEQAGLHEIDVVSV
jgi:arginine/lysine/ornithine decarboxylase